MAVSDLSVSGASLAMSGRVVQRSPEPTPAQVSSPTTYELCDAGTVEQGINKQSSVAFLSHFHSLLVNPGKAQKRFEETHI